MKSLIHISLLIIAITKIYPQIFGSLYYGKDIIFDRNHNRFELHFLKEGALFIGAKFPIESVVTLRIAFPEREIFVPVTPKGIGKLLPVKTGLIYIIELQFDSDSNERGILWMNPSIEKIDVYTHNTYEFDYNIKENLGNRLEKYQLTYSIDNVFKDTKLKFKYNDKFNYEADKIATNPLKICHRGQCTSNITTYDIKKGEHYKMYIIVNVYRRRYQKTEFYNNIYYLPSFSFSFDDKEEIKVANEKFLFLNNLTKTKIAGLIIISILLLAGIGLGAYFIYRKKFKSNLEKHIKLELETLNGNN